MISRYKLMPEYHTITTQIFPFPLRLGLDSAHLPDGRVGHATGGDIRGISVAVLAIGRREVILVPVAERRRHRLAERVAGAVQRGDERVEPVRVAEVVLRGAAGARHRVAHARRLRPVEHTVRTQQSHPVTGHGHKEQTQLKPSQSTQSKGHPNKTKILGIQFFLKMKNISMMHSC